jgi:mono/diheme cytochrome c family protein
MQVSPPFSFLTGLAVLVAVAAVARGDEPIDYNRDIRPLLSDRCFFCHGPDRNHREADLRLDDEEAAKEWVIVPGKPEESELITRVTSDDESTRMPPAESGKELSAEEIDLLRRWIEQDAPYAPYWAYVPPRRHPVPDVQDETWPNNWIDNFIQYRLEREQLQPAPEADRVTLLRRLSFDLTGLPPTPDEVDAFLNDESPDAYEKLVDRLLDSDRYGERMAIYWLDLVRYADTVGYHGDQDHSISPYRDYVIDAFNDNLPFDQFTKEQLAGDLLPDPAEPSPTIDQQIATGYNRLLQTSHEGGVQPKEYLAIYASDRVRNLSAVWMGATMGCAECHDHKYDPYTMQDFYAMQAFFADVDEAQHFKVGGNALPTNRPPEIEVLSRRERERIAELEKLLASGGRKSPDDKTERQLRAEIEAIESNARKTMVTVSIEPRTIRILPRGNWLDDSGPVVTPAVPEFLGTLDVGDRRANRLDLAHWLTDPDKGVGGLTARVMANRLWYLLFGTGLSNSLDDFGGQGEPPVHPELLDNLAVEFLESGWDVKRMMKRIVMSRAYRQSSVSSPELRHRDPDNRLYARQSRFRLPAEMVRDNALAISGLLVLDYGGASVKPYQPAGYYRHLNFPKRRYEQHDDERQWRRGVYVHWQRQFLHPMLKAFDAPSREECTSQRPRSNTPLAALVLLNDPTFVEAARGFAARILDEGGETDDTRLDHAFRLSVSRNPDEFERELLLELLNENRRQYRDDPASAEKLLEIGLSDLGRNGDAVELAAWTQLARAMLNMNETITRN